MRREGNTVDWYLLYLKRVTPTDQVLSETAASSRREGIAWRGRVAA